MKTLARPYLMTKQINQGGCATLHRCIDSVGNRYACKRIRKSHVQRDRILTEIDITRRLNEGYGHPRIVRYVDSTEDDEYFCIIMELCSSGSVADGCLSYGDESKTQNMISDVLRGLMYMHETHGVIHGDIKPANVLVGALDAFISEEGDFKLCDFGTSMLMDDKGVVDIPRAKMAGTPWFMAPETLTHQSFSRQSDIWSVGILAYTVLGGGRLPFDDHENPMNASIVNIWQSVLQDDVPFDGGLWEYKSQQAKDFIRTCLDRDVTRRFPSAMECLQHPWLKKNY
jgi:serine/threonine protein kinase